jgi:hypothetical protein
MVCAPLGETWIRITPNGHVLHADQQSPMHFGTNDIVTRSLYDYVHPEDADLLKRTLLAPFTEYSDIQCRLRNMMVWNVVRIRVYFPCREGSEWFLVQIQSEVLNELLEGDVQTPVSYTNENLFDMFSSSKTCSLNNEMNRLRIMNKRLRDEILIN